MKHLKVRFSTVTVYEFVDDTKEGRLKYWEYFALDRIRFKDRISTCSVILDPILIKKYESLKR